jgi:hypothetical protein
MKVKSRDISLDYTLSLEDENGPFGFVKFRKITRRKLVDYVVGNSKKAAPDVAGETYFEQVCASIVEIEGLKEGGEPVTVEKIKAGDVLNDTMNFLGKCYGAMLADKEEDEKKELADALLPVLDGS